MMSVGNFLGHVFRRKTQCRLRPAKALATRKLAIEQLENRLVPATLTFLPDADAYVQQSAPSSNGNSANLYADGSPVVSSFLRFQLSGVVGTVQGAKLRL